MFSLFVSFALAAAPAPRYHYKGPDNVCFCDVETIAAEIRKNPDAKHTVWMEGWGAWKSWDKVPELRAAVGGASTAGWSYAMNGGAVETLSASDIASRVAENPNAQHLVWKEGMEQWQEPKAVPELASLLPASETVSAPAPAAATPPPLPKESTPPRMPDAPDRTNEPPRPDPGVRREDGPPPRQDDGPGMPQGGQPPLNPPPTHGIDMHLGNMVTLGADTRVELAWDHLENALLYEGFSIPTFRLERFVPRIDATLAPFASARASLWIAQQDVVTLVDTETTLSAVVDAGAPGILIAPDDIYVDLHGGSKIRHHARVGVAAPIFGGSEAWEAEWRFGGLDTWQPAVVAAGMVPYRDVGVSYGFGQEKWDVTGQVQNGNGVGDFDVNEGKDLSGRISVRPIDQLSLEASVLYGPRALYSDASLLLAHAAVDVHLAMLRGRVEAYYGKNSEQGLDAQPFGFNAALGATLTLPKGPVGHVDVDGRFLYADPDLVDEAGADFNPDGTWTYSYAVAANAGWRMPPQHDLYTGVVFTSSVPELTDDPISYSLALQQGWRF